MNIHPMELNQREKIYVNLHSELSLVRKAIVFSVFRRKKGLLHMPPIPTMGEPEDYDEYYALVCQLNQQQSNILKRAWNAIRDFINDI